MNRLTALNLLALLLRSMFHIISTFSCYIYNMLRKKLSFISLLAPLGI